MNEGNIEDLFDGPLERGVPSAMELCFLNSSNDATACSSYTADRSTRVCNDDNEDSPCLEAVGYTQGDYTLNSICEMKASALAHCLDGKRFLQVRSGDKLVSEDNPALLAWVFPHLDPFGIGAFNEPNRAGNRSLSFPRQVHNLILQHNSPFANDANFAYVCWNVIQKRELNRSLIFRIPVGECEQLGRRLYELAPALTDLLRIWETEPWAVPKTNMQKEAISLVNRLQSVAKHLRGTSGYKQARRHELRGLIRKFGTPALFITINPADVFNPLMGIFGGIETSQWCRMTQFERACFVAKNPAAAAQFFDEILRNFLSIVVTPGAARPSLFGICDAYYGMVEAQGCGTLHCHMLLWIRGNPNPELLRE